MWSPDAPLETERVELEEATDLRVIAENLGLPVDQVKELNPHVLRWTTPPDDSEFELILPKGYSEKFQDKVANLPEKERILWRYHNVKKGETLSVIARNYGVAVNDLTQANRISTKTSLKIGQEILIPVSGAVPGPEPRHLLQPPRRRWRPPNRRRLPRRPIRSNEATP